MAQGLQVPLHTCLITYLSSFLLVSILFGERVYILNSPVFFLSCHNFGVLSRSCCDVMFALIFYIHLFIIRFKTDYLIFCAEI